MRKSNPVLAGVAAVALAATLVPAFAMAAEANKTTDTTEVKYAVTEGYTWTIPSAIDFGKDAGVNKTVEKTADTNGATAKVAVTKNVIADGKALQITAKGSGTADAFTIKNGSTTLGYTIKVGGSTDALAVNGEVIKVPAGTNADEKGLTFTLTTTTGTSEVAGNYEGTVTYTAAIVNNN